MTGSISLASLTRMSAAGMLTLLMSGCVNLEWACRYGDTSYADNTLLTLSDGKLYICASGKWIEEKRIQALVYVDQASLWTDCCGWADLTAYANAACGGMQECWIPPSNYMAEHNLDPRTRRRLLVRYHCEKASREIPTSHYAKQVEEEETLKLSCKAF